MLFILQVVRLLIEVIEVRLEDGDGNWFNWSGVTKNSGKKKTVNKMLDENKSLIYIFFSNYFWIIFL